MWEQAVENRLLGLTVNAIRVETDTIQYDTDKGTLQFKVDGDCCSESWFSDIVGPQNIIGKKIVDIREASVSEYNLDDGRCRQEVDSVYGTVLVAEDGGECTVYFRNSSNGYYGGWMSSNGFVERQRGTPVESDWRS